MIWTSKVKDFDFWAKERSQTVQFLYVSNTPDQDVTFSKKNPSMTVSLWVDKRNPNIFMNGRNYTHLKGGIIRTHKNHFFLVTNAVK